MISARRVYKFLVSSVSTKLSTRSLTISLVRGKKPIYHEAIVLPLFFFEADREKAGYKKANSDVICLLL